MTEANFSANSVLNSYLQTEKMLADVLRVVPYCKEHEHVWSPALATIMLESCSQLDSLWKIHVDLSKTKKKKAKKPNMRYYHSQFGSVMAPTWVVFWGEEPEELHPYAPWREASKCQELDWWGASNKLKHDRFSNRNKATLQRAVHALAGLFLAIIKCESCADATTQANWISVGGGKSLHAAFGDHNLVSYLKKPSSEVREDYVTVESGLFSHALGWPEPDTSWEYNWNGPASLRFQGWFNQQARAQAPVIGGAGSAT